MKQVAFLFFPLFFFWGCQKDTESPDWLLGSWHNTTTSMDAQEHWKKMEATVFEAESFILVQKDTVFYEHVDLKKTSKGWDYIVSVRDQNKEKPVCFSSTYIGTDSLVFENSKHDFPNRIVYKKIKADSLVATIFGMQNGKATSEIFPFKKMKP
ncbi:DUF6265 family protein [Flavobacterium sp.]|uniref:DUF6265 family protein n=1 Tax=Flavobacterium sp. TaxID=239 RepID=UPI0026127359|nr:DUF6265 family protein [Flavobacterium sp.]